MSTDWFAKKLETDNFGFGFLLWFFGFNRKNRYSETAERR
jgi:hypothetical protein